MEPKDELIDDQHSANAEEISHEEADKIAGGGEGYGSDGSENS